jgi:peptidoglycan/LPS O-acetylase OafA/YrhL
LTIWGVINGILVFNGVAGWPLISLALGLAGCAAVVAVSALLAQSRVFEPLRYCGERSIVIYLAFFLGMAASRSVLLKYGWIADIGTVSAIVTLAGIVGALLLYWTVRRTPLRFLFERPDRFWIAPRKPLVLQPAQ